MTTTTKQTVADAIRHLHPCDKALEWAAGYTSPAKAWAECQDGSWMLWLLGKLAGPPESESHKVLVLCACDCARLALPYTTDPRVLACIETAEKWARGEATIEQLREARSPVYDTHADTADAAADAAAYAADAAADAAAYAADAADAAAYAADAAADAAAYADAAADTADAAADAAAYAADAADTAAADACAAAYAARSRILVCCADIVRRYYPKPPRVKGE